MSRLSPDEPDESEPEHDEEDHDDENASHLDDPLYPPIKRLHEATAFVILHQKDPWEIARRLDPIANAIRESSQIPGLHQAKALQLALELGAPYWLSTKRLNDWIDLISPLVRVAMSSVRDDALSTRFFQAFGIFQSFAATQEKAETTLLQALEFAKDARREDLQLMVRATKLNMNAFRVPLEDIETEAQSILTEARRLKYSYVMGRVYLTLARTIAFCCQSDQRLFEYAQQAFILMRAENDMGLGWQALSMMIGQLQRQNDHSPKYRFQLLTQMGQLEECTIYPWFQATLYHLWSIFYFHQGDYEKARFYSLKAFAHCRAFELKSDKFYIRHQFAMIQSKRHRWKAAERHLRACAKHYKNTGSKNLAFNLDYIIAYMPLEQNDPARALSLLWALRRRVRHEIDNPVSQADLIYQISKDIKEAIRRLRIQRGMAAD
ncbi:MAG: hypothetical protein HY866_00300 [Chloroflexi bacterium]|nr:hypothetical protein [Chloroflexota bacterium]